MNTTLNEYVTRYYVRWLDYANYLCNAHGLRQEDAYDIFSESLLALLTKSAEVIDGLLACEGQGEKKLFYYTRKIILNNVLQFKMRGWHYPNCANIECLANTTTDAADDALLDCDEAIYNSIREIEATFREDSFYEPVPHLDLPVKRDIEVGTSVFTFTPQITPRQDGSMRCYIPIAGTVYYNDGGRRRSKTKYFPTRGAARGWAERSKAEILAGVLTL